MWTPQVQLTALNRSFASNAAGQKGMLANVPIFPPVLRLQVLRSNGCLSRKAFDRQPGSIFCGLKSINSVTPQAFKSFKLQIGSTFNFPTCKFRQLRWRNYGSSFAMSRMTAKRAEEGRSTCLPTPRSCLARYPLRAYGGCCRGRNSLTLKPRKHEVMKRAGMRLSGGPAG